ncbi:MAG: hypothetical protein HPY75_07050 [Actinobacteria bacterium]|nr:hypothetical protein [Actinomycetota bacterium]
MRRASSHGALGHAAIPVLCGLLLMALAAGAFLLGGCGEKKVSLEYEPRSDQALVTVSRGGGLPFPGDDLAPLFRLFGDGTFLALEEQGCGNMLVRGHLEQADVEDLLRRVAGAGFFDLEDEYADPDVYDATYRMIAVDLAETDKSVKVWMTRDVPAFDAAYDLILAYPLGETSEYVPERGYLVVVRYPLDEGGDRQQLDPGSEVYGLLPDAATLNRAADAHTAVALEGAAFARLKEYENSQESRGLYLRQADSVLVVYPVYEPRMADTPS